MCSDLVVVGVDEILVEDTPDGSQIVVDMPHAADHFVLG